MFASCDSGVGRVLTWAQDDASVQDHARWRSGGGDDKVRLSFEWAIVMLKAIHSYLSPFAFTQTLLPLLIATAKQPGSDVRVVNV